MTNPKIERFFCNKCKVRTKHFIRGEYDQFQEHPEELIWLKQRMLIVECCGCENLELVKRTLFSEDVEYFDNPVTGESDRREKWDEQIYPPVTYRLTPPWFEDLPDPTLKAISSEIYKSLQTESHFLAAKISQKNLY